MCKKLRTIDYFTILYKYKLHHALDRTQNDLAVELLAALNSNDFVHMFSRFFLTMIQPHETGSLKNISTNRMIVYLSTVDKLLPKPQREIQRKLYPP